MAGGRPLLDARQRQVRREGARFRRHAKCRRGAVGVPSQPSNPALRCRTRTPAGHADWERTTRRTWTWMGARGAMAATAAFNSGKRPSGHSPMNLVVMCQIRRLAPLDARHGPQRVISVSRLWTVSAGRSRPKNSLMNDFHCSGGWGRWRAPIFRAATVGSPERTVGRRKRLPHKDRSPSTALWTDAFVCQSGGNAYALRSYPQTRLL